MPLGLSSRIDRARRWAGWFVSADPESDDPEVLLRGTLLVLTSWVLLLFHTILLVQVVLASRAMPAPILVVMALIELIYAAIPWALRWTRSHRFAAGLLIGAMAIVLGMISYYNGSFGNFSGITVPWLAALPLLGAFFAGPRFAALAGSVVVLFLITLYQLDLRGYPFPPAASQEVIDWFSLLSGSTAVCFVALFGVLYERSRRAGLDLARRRLVELTGARDEARAASQAKSRFVANVSHELRTPLNGVIGMTDLLLRSRLDADQRHFALTIRSSARTLLALINEILDAAKIEAGRLTAEWTDCDVRRSVGDVVAILGPRAEAKGVVLQSQVAPEVPEWVLADPVRLRQILANLSDNAIKFTRQGRVKVSARVEDAHGAPRLFFEVEDSGEGIPEEARAQLFTPFFQADSSGARTHGGTGLGLAIAKSLVELMDGTIGFESAVGEGSRFFFDIPLRPATGLGEDSGVLRTLPTGTAVGRVLVAEDNAVNRSVITRQLVHLGYSVDVVTDGFSCVERAEQGQHEALLMDLQMPGLDGLEATRRIRAREGPARRTVIIAVTASAAQGERARCLAAGMDDFLGKPVELRALAEVMHRWVPVGGLQPQETPPPVPVEELERELARETEKASVDPAVVAALVGPAGGGVELVAELLAVYLADTEEAAGALRQAAQAAELTRVDGLAHKLKSSSATVGARQLVRLCQALEHAARSGDVVRVQGLVGEVEAEVPRVRELLLASLKRTTPAAPPPP